MSPAPHILIVDDDTRINDLISRFLHQSGFITSSAFTVGQAENHCALCSFDAVILDVMLPDKNGIDFLKSMRAGETNAHIPILMLSALGEATDRIKALSHLADDYLVKPFEPEELILRLKSLLRRTPPALLPEKTDIMIAGFHFYPDRFLLQSTTKTISLTASESLCLDFLYQNAMKNYGQTVSRDSIAITVGEDKQEERSVDVLIARLRKKIETDPKRPHYILTIRGQGYKLCL